MIDLWPKIESKELITPVTILRQQASLLGKKTKNILEAEIKDLKVESVSDSDSDFHYAFYIVATALGFYRYKIMEIFYSMDLYPVKIRVESEIEKEIPSHFVPSVRYRENDFEASSEKDFLELLKVVFNSTKVIRVISVLLAQSDTGYDPSLKEETQQ